MELRTAQGNTWVFAREPALPAAEEEWVACVMASASASPFAFAEAATHASLAASCRLIVIAAPNAEEVHDHIHWIVEEREALDTVTTFHCGPEALEDAVALIEPSLTPPGQVHVFSDDPDRVESQVRSMGLVAD